MKKFGRADKTATFPFLVLAVSILFTLGISYLFYQSAKTKDLIRFNNEVNRLQLAIETKTNLYVALLKGGRGFIESNREITRENFREYIESLDLGKNHSGVQGIGYVKVVAPNERETLTAKMKSEGYENFQIFPAEEKKSYRVNLYFEPLNERNQKAIGFDMSSEVVRCEALDRARDSGEAATSGKVILIQENETKVEPGFLIFLPIYKQNGRINSSDERNQNLIGYIYSPFNASSFLREIQSDKSAFDVFMKIYDGEPNQNNLMTQSIAFPESSFGSQLEEIYATKKEVNVAGRKWVIEYNSLPAFAAQSSLGWSPLIFIIGILFSFALFGMTYWETSARIKLQSAVADLFESEQQKQGLLEKEQAARLSAEQANKTKDEFIAVVSHELRTPLNSIGGWTRILRTDELSENTRKLALEKIEKNLRSQTRLVEDLLDYSQIVSGTLVFEDREVNFSNVFENALAEIEPAAKEKNIALSKDNQLNGLMILGDEDKMKLVMRNLLINAIKFTQVGGKIETSLKENDGAIKMIIKDNGKGISADFLPHIFDRFTQADTSSTRNFGGLGLGLTISNHIVKLHRGRIEAVSEGTGKGTTFIVTIPRFIKID